MHNETNIKMYIYCTYFGSFFVFSKNVGYFWYSTLFLEHLVFSPFNKIIIKYQNTNYGTVADRVPVSRGTVPRVSPPYTYVESLFSSIFEFVPWGTVPRGTGTRSGTVVL